MQRPRPVSFLLRELFLIVGGTNWRNVLRHRDVFAGWCGLIGVTLWEIAFSFDQHVLRLRLVPAPGSGKPERPAPPVGGKVVNVKTGAVDVLLHYQIAKRDFDPLGGQSGSAWAVLERVGPLPWEEFWREWRAVGEARGEGS